MGIYDVVSFITPPLRTSFFECPAKQVVSRHVASVSFMQGYDKRRPKFRSTEKPRLFYSQRQNLSAYKPLLQQASHLSVYCLANGLAEELSCGSKDRSKTRFSEVGVWMLEERS
jgi:hypothetical protein